MSGIWYINLPSFLKTKKKNNMPRVVRHAMNV